jgi:hypothetical protein
MPHRNENILPHRNVNAGAASYITPENQKDGSPKAQPWTYQNT